MSFVNSKSNIIGVQIINPNSSSLLSVWSRYILGNTHISADLRLILLWLASCNSLFFSDFYSFHSAFCSDSTSPRDYIIYNKINLFGLCILNDDSTT